MCNNSQILFGIYDLLTRSRPANQLLLVDKKIYLEIRKDHRCNTQRVSFLIYESVDDILGHLYYVMSQ